MSEIKQHRIETTAWCADDGSFGSGQVILFDFADLTADELECLDTLGDNSKFEFLLAVLNGEDLSEWLEEESEEK